MGSVSSASNSHGRMIDSFMIDSLAVVTHRILRGLGKRTELHQRGEAVLGDGAQTVLGAESKLRGFTMARMLPTGLDVILVLVIIIPMGR